MSEKEIKAKPQPQPDPRIVQVKMASEAAKTESKKSDKK